MPFVWAFINRPGPSDRRPTSSIWYLPRKLCILLITKRITVRKLDVDLDDTKSYLASKRSTKDPPKIRFVKCYVFSILSYGVEAWTLTLQVVWDTVYTVMLRYCRLRNCTLKRSCNSDKLREANWIIPGSNAFRQATFLQVFCGTPKTRQTKNFMHYLGISTRLLFGATGEWILWLKIR